MFYNHWKKIALSLTALFWAGCEDSASSAVCLYGPDPNYSSATENPVSSSSEASQPESSSSFDLERMALDYGIDIDFTCSPMDSSVAYFAQDYSADTKKMWKEEEAKQYLANLMATNPYESVVIVNRTGKERAVYAFTAKESAFDSNGDGKPDSIAKADN